ncbi:MAG TPA: DUF1850 domain-containing protein [Candidatus Avidesulfovibrio excrementigallinarum]|nr:DUF1850 domain-containing protein [Candidatus Avidesulfovibrio excrementigallinarum]
MANIARFGAVAKALARARSALPAWSWLALAALLLGASLPWRPVETLVIERKDGQAWHVAVPLGQPVVTRYIHSVERTPVEDWYYPLGGMLYQWRTRSRSHNAGLPWKAPDHGRFLSEEGWLVLEGGLPAWQAIRLRVGNETFGRNEMRIGSGPWEALYSRFPGERLCLSAGRAALGTALKSPVRHKTATPQKAAPHTDQKGLSSVF